MKEIPNLLKLNKTENKKSLEEKKWDYLNFQFQYIDKLENGELLSEDRYYKTFGDRLEGYSGVTDRIRNMYIQRVSLEKYNDSDYCDFQDLVTNRIRIDHENNPNTWRENVRKIVTEEVEKLGPVLTNTENIDPENKNKAGLIEFQLGKGYEELSQIGMNENTECLTIHFPSMAEQKEKNENINSIFSQNSLSELAVKIVEEHPEVKAVVGVSWIIDSPIGKRIGFNVFDIDKDVGQGTEFWGQFIDENGNIKEDKAKKFLETGVPEYRVAHGVIKVEDFLKKYLPENKRGEVKLKSKTPEFLEFENTMADTRNKISDDTKNYTPEEVESFLKENKYLRDFLKTPDGIKFLQLTQKAIKEKVMIGDVAFEGKDEIMQKLGDYLKPITDKKFITKILNIE